MKLEALFEDQSERAKLDKQIKQQREKIAKLEAEDRGPGGRASLRGLINREKTQLNMLLGKKERMDDPTGEKKSEKLAQTKRANIEKRIKQLEKEASETKFDYHKRNLEKEIKDLQKMLKDHS